MKTYRIALLPGDGIGKEVVPAAVRVLEAAASGFSLSFQSFDWSCDYYHRTGRMMPADGIDQIRPFDAVLLGAVGHPSVPDHVSLRGLLIPMRFEFDLFANIRPVEVLPGIETPLRFKTREQINMLFIRENTEGEYAGAGGRFKQGTPDEVAIQESIYTRKGTERVIRYAFDRARRRPRRRLASITKSNAMQYGMVMWDETFAEVARDYPDVETAKYLVDAAAARMITAPESLDVVVASNLFADILTDLGGALQGSLGLAASGNINPVERLGPPIFEPVHGSAPDIEGKKIANPTAAIWAASMMMDHLGEPAAASRILKALGSVIADGKVRTRDLGGKSSTDEFADAVSAKVQKLDAQIETAAR
ncbi:MAG: tartrate dehydrogenase [Terriglobia bacterium]